MNSPPGFDPELETTVVYEGNGAQGFHTIRIPALVRTRENVLLAFAEARRDGARDDGHIELALRRSRDGGQSWEPLEILVAEEGDVTMGNPCPFVLRESGEVVLLFTRNNQRAFCMRSADGGEFFSEPEEITETCRAFEYPWVRIATGPVHGLELSGGRLVAPSWLSDSAHRAPERHFRSCTLLSDDGGRTWRTGAVIGSDEVDFNECTAYGKRDGTVVLNMRSGIDPEARYTAESADGGESFSAFRREPALAAPPCQGSTLVLPETDGKTRLLFSDILPRDPNDEGVEFKKSRTRLTVRLSYDEGETWPVSREVTSGPSGYADMTLLADGTVGMLCESGEERYNQRLVFCRFAPAWVEAGGSR
jgi:sialidase-1